MKVFVISIFALFNLFACGTNESVFELSPQQSMLIYGKGLGQDATVNPYSDGNSVATIKNLSKNDFVVRIQNQGVIIEAIKIHPSETKQASLPLGHELYLDSELAAKAKVTFKPAK